MPKSQEQFEEIREKSKERILLAALELFGNQGYHSTSVSQIAAKAGISKGLMYNYFSSKEELLKVMIEHSIGEREKILREIYDEDPKVFMRNLIERFFQNLQTDTDHWRLLTSLSLQLGQFNFIKEMSIPRMDEYKTKFGSLMEAIGIEDPFEEAIIFSATLGGIARQYFVMGDAYPVEEIKNYLLKKYKLSQTDDATKN